MTMVELEAENKFLWDILLKLKEVNKAWGYIPTVEWSRIIGEFKDFPS